MRPVSSGIGEKEKVMGPKPKQCVCHPERKHASKGLCHNCYSQQYRILHLKKFLAYEKKRRENPEYKVRIRKLNKDLRHRRPKSLSLGAETILGYYVYFYLREDGTPYYVGKGRGNRVIERHRIGRPKSRDFILIQEYPSEQDALDAEKFFIDLFGRIDLGTGILRNLTEGGNQPPSRKGSSQSLETRQKLREKLRGRKLTQEHCDNIGKGHLGIPCSESKREKIRMAQEGKSRPKLQGIHNGLAVLTEDIVREIRRQELSYRLLAQKFGIAKSTVHDVVKRKTWTHV